MIEGADWTAIRTRLRPFVQARLTGSADIEDVLQEILIRIHRGLPSLDDERRIDGWMYRVATNAIHDYGRGVQRSPKTEHGEADEWTDREEDADDETLERLTACVAAFVSMLPSPYREAVTLVELERLSHPEAAKMVGISVSGMKSRVQRGRRKLRDMLEQCCAIEVDGRNRPVSCEARPDGRLPSCR